MNILLLRFCPLAVLIEYLHATAYVRALSSARVHVCVSVSFIGHQ